MAYPPLAVCVGLPAGITGGALMFVWVRLDARGRRDRTTWSLFIASIISIIVAISAVFAQIYWEYSDREAMRHVTLDYSVQLSINGTGMVRVSLPIPVDERVFQDAHIQPASSTYALNRSGNEKMMDIVMSENTTLHARLYGLKSEIPVDLTETTPESEYHGNCDNCTSEIGMIVLAGTVTDVHVVLRVDWSSLCTGGATWNLECSAVPGRSDYQGHWMPHPVC